MEVGLVPQFSTFLSRQVLSPDSVPSLGMSVCAMWVAPDTAQYYLTLRSVWSLNNPLNIEIKFCENMN
jgi:hypothetical protein